MAGQERATVQTTRQITESIDQYLDTSHTIYMLIRIISGVLIRAISGVLIRTISSYDEEEVANCSIKGIIVFSDDFQDDLTFAIIVHYILCSAKLKI